MADKKLSFKDFIKESEQDPSKLEDARPDLVPQPIDEVNNGELENSKIPALFATIHWQSDDRPHGHTPEEIWELNLLANHHMPELQKDMIDSREQEGHDVSKYRDPEWLRSVMGSEHK